MSHRIKLFKGVVVAALSALLMLGAILIIFPAYASSTVSMLTATVRPDSLVTLSWEDKLEDILYYVVERKIDNGPFIRIAYLSEDSTNFTDTLDAFNHQGATYTYRILTCRYSSNTYSFLYENYSNELNFKSSDIAVPTSLTAVPANDSQVDLTWSYPMNTTYKTIVERRIAGYSNWIPIAELPEGIFTYEDKNLTANKEYYYRVKARSDVGLESTPFPANSTGVRVFTLLKSPSKLTGKATSLTQIDLTWDDTPGETGYIIERRSGSESFTPIRTVYANTTVFHDTGLAPNRLYIYRVRALYQDAYRTNVSNYTNELSVVSSPINPPSELKAILTPYGEVELFWKCQVKFENGFEIWRRPKNSNSWTKIAITGRKDRSYTDSSNEPGTLYHYKVRSFMALNNDVSQYSAEVTAGFIEIIPPGTLQYKVISPSRVIISWSDITTNESSYVVEYRAQPDLTWTQVAVLPASTTSFTASGLSSGKKCYYRIKALNSTYGTYSYSKELAVEMGYPNPPQTTGIKVLSSSRIRISWNKKDDKALSYHIERSIDGETFIEIGSSGKEEHSFVDTHLSPSTRYYYRVRSKNISGYSTYSSIYLVYTKKSASYSDIRGLGEYQTAIEDLASRGIFSTQDGTLFSPGKVLTRGEMICWIVKAFSLEKMPVGSFADVTPSHPFYREIMIAARYGIITAGENANFRPDAAITREDACVLLTKTLQLLEKPLQGYPLSLIEKYADFGSVGSQALPSVVSCIGGDIISPIAETLIGPDYPVSKMEGALMLFKVIDR